MNTAITSEEEYLKELLAKLNSVGHAIENWQKFAENPALCVQKGDPNLNRNAKAVLNNIADFDSPKEIFFPEKNI